MACMQSCQCISVLGSALTLLHHTTELIIYFLAILHKLRLQNAFLFKLWLISSGKAVVKCHKTFHSLSSHSNMIKLSSRTLLRRSRLKSWCLSLPAAPALRVMPAKVRNHPVGLWSMYNYNKTSDYILNVYISKMALISSSLNLFILVCSTK